MDHRVRHDWSNLAWTHRQLSSICPGGLKMKLRWEIIEWPSDREEEILYDIPFVWNLKKKNGTHELIYRTERDSQRTNLWLLGEGWGGKIVREFGMDMYTLLYLKWITNKDRLYSTWNSAQYCLAAWMEKEVWGRTDTCICMTECLHYSPEIITVLLIGYP